MTAASVVLQGDMGSLAAVGHLLSNLADLNGAMGQLRAGIGQVRDSWNVDAACEHKISGYSDAFALATTHPSQSESWRTGSSRQATQLLLCFEYLMDHWQDHWTLERRPPVILRA